MEVAAPFARSGVAYTFDLLTNRSVQWNVAHSFAFLWAT
jgi:hypothetical protein